jgi:hypothetical protein
MTLAEARAWLEEHKAETDVAEYLAGLSRVTPEAIRAHLETDDGKRLIQPAVDRAVTQGIDTWRTNNLDKLVQAEHDKRFPPEDERDARLRELEARVAESERNATRKDLLATAMRTATEKGLPVGIIDRFIGDDAKSTDAYLEALETNFKAAVDAEVDKRFKGRGTPPPSDTPPGDDKEPNPWKKDAWNLTQQARITREDPEKAKRLKAAAGKA